MKNFDNNSYNIYNSHFFNKFKAFFLRKGHGSKMENTLYFLFKNLKKKNYNVFLFFLLTKNSYLPFPAIKVSERKRSVQVKPPFNFEKSYFHGLKTLEKFNKKNDSCFNNVSDSIWSLLLTESYFFEKKQSYFDSFWLSRLLRTRKRTRFKRFKKRKRSKKRKSF